MDRLDKNNNNATSTPMTTSVQANRTTGNPQIGNRNSLPTRYNAAKTKTQLDFV